MSLLFLISPSLFLFLLHQRLPFAPDRLVCLPLFFAPGEELVAAEATIGFDHAPESHAGDLKESEKEGERCQLIAFKESRQTRTL